MKAIVVRQPWATLIALGIKTIETRPAPPNGPMRPDGVRGLPGLAIERGERIAIVAGAQPGTKVGEDLGDSGWYWESTVADPSCIVNWKQPAIHDAPLGAVVCTVQVDNAWPMEDCPPYSTSFDDRWEPEPPSVLYLGGLDGGPWAFIDGNGPIPFIDQLPFGDFTPGRWGWLLSDPRPCEPIPCKGKQGVFRLPDAVADRFGADQ